MRRSGGRRMGLAGQRRWLRLFERIRRDPLLALTAFLASPLREPHAVSGRDGECLILDDMAAPGHDLIPEAKASGDETGTAARSAATPDRLASRASGGAGPAAFFIRPAREGEARLSVRDGERPGVLEILSIDAAGECIVHRVSGLALMNLAAKAVEQVRRGAVA